MRTLVLGLIPLLLMHAAERKAVFPPSAKPVGPYSPGVMAGDYLYVSGQGARDAAGKLPATIEDQTRQCLENIKTIVEAAGLTMDHIVYTHTYLTDLKNYSAMNAAYATFFKDPLPARSTMGVVRMPLETPVEINAVAIRDLTARKAVNPAQSKGGAPLSTGILTPDRYFLSGILGRDAVSGDKPEAPEGQLAIAEKRLRAALEAANLDTSKLVYVNAYRTAALPAEKLRSALRKVAPEAAISVVEVAALPYGVSVGLTGVAVRDAAQKRVYRQAGEVLCASAGETVYCAAQGAAQVGDALTAIDKGLKSLGSSLSKAVANTVYLDDIDHFQTMNAAYALSFPAPPPTRTTIQPVPPAGKVSVAVVAVR